MKNKILRITFILIIFFLVAVGNVSAWFIPNKTSFAVGALYHDDVDTTVDANNAHSAYNSMGLSYTKKINNPTISEMIGKHSNGTSYLNSGIVFLSGHGLTGSQGMVFENNGSSPFYIMAGSYTGSSIDIGNYVDSLNALVVLAGCETAAGSNNISKYVVDHGAKASIGWTESVKAGSHTNWLKRFNNKIKDKSTTVSAAKSSADSYIYLDSRVKTGKIYGSGNYNPWYFMNGGTYSASSSNFNYQMDIDNLEDNEYLITKEGSIENLPALVENYIISNINNKFDINDYVLEINGSDTIYYDYILYIDGIRTSYGYTVSITDGKIIKLYDNMNKDNIEKIKKNISHKSKIKANYNAINEKFDLQIKEKYQNAKIEKKLITDYYDDEDGKTYHVVLYDIITEDGILISEDYREEI